MVCTGKCYLGGYIGDDVSKCDWLKNRTEKWERDINSLSKTADKFPQVSYDFVARAVQPKWIFLKRVMKNPDWRSQGWKMLCGKPSCLLCSLEN